MALHAPQVHGFFSVPVDHLTAIGVLAEHFRGSDLTNTVVVSPDLGNAKTATQFARLLGLPVAAGSKQRLSDDSVVIDAIVGDVAGKTRDRAGRRDRHRRLDHRAARPAGSSSAAPRPRWRLHARAVHRQGRRAAAVAPVDHRGGHHRHRAAARTDFPELQVRSVAGLFAEAITRIHAGESVSSLFDGVDPTHGPPQPKLPF